MKQKFQPGDFVKVSEEMPKYMSHFEKGFVGCIEGSYNDLYGLGSTKDKEYAVIQFKNGKPVNRISWYPEKLLERFDGLNLMNYFKKHIKS